MNNSQFKIKHQRWANIKLDALGLNLNCNIDTHRNSVYVNFYKKDCLFDIISMNWQRHNMNCKVSHQYIDISKSKHRAVLDVLRRTIEQEFTKTR